MMTCLAPKIDWIHKVNRIIRLFSKITKALVVFVFVFSCEKAEDMKDNTKLNSMAEFERVFGFEFNLPIRDSEFLKMLESQGITYSVRGHGEYFTYVPRKRYSKNPELVYKAVKIYGPFNNRMNRKEDFLLFVDENGYGYELIIYFVTPSL